MIAVDKSTRDELLREADRLLTAEGPAGAQQWLSAARDFFPQAADLSVDFIKLLVRRGMGGDAGLLLRQVCRAHPLRLDILEVLGKYTRSAQPVIGPPVVDGAAYANPADSEFVTVFGNSYVRSFASGTRFFPLLIGPGRATSFITPERAAITRRMTFSNISRVDPRSLVVMVYGNGDANNHLRNDFGTWTEVENGAIPSHEALLSAAAERYCEMVAEIRQRHRLNLVLFCASPMLDPRLMPLVEVFNKVLRTFGGRAGIPVLDVTAELKDSATGCLRKDLCSADDNDHIGHELVPLVERGLDKLGLLPRENRAFSWDYMFRFAVDPEIETRIWSEPHIGAGNVLHSGKVMFTQIVERAAHVFTGMLAVQPGTVLVINGKEGFVPLELAPALAPTITSLDVAAGKAVMGRRVARFAGRDRNVNFVTLPLADIADAETSYDYAFMVIHPGDDAEACIALLPALAGKVRRGIFLLTAVDWSARLAALSGYNNVVSLNLSNRLVTGYWAGARLFALLH